MAYALTVSEEEWMDEDTPLTDDEESSQKGEKVKETWDTPLHVHLSDFEIKCKSTEGVIFKVAKENTLTEFTEGVLAAFEETKRPMCITVDVLNRYFLEEESEDIESAVKSISEAAAASGIHRVTFSTVRYSPDLARHWADLHLLNNFIRQYTSQRGEQPLNLHKIYLAPSGGQFVTQGLMYHEFFERSSLGRNPSESAVFVNAHWVDKHHKSAYFNVLKPSGKQVAMLPLPIPLGMTASFTEDEIYLNILKSRGLYRGKRSRSMSRVNNRRKVSHRTRSRERSDSCVSGARPRGERSPHSISVLERLLNRVSKGGSRRDPHGKERETHKLSERVATLYQEKCAQVTQLQVEVETCRLELELLKDKKQVEFDAQILTYKQDNAKLRHQLDQMDNWNYKLGKMKDGIDDQNDKLINELQLLKMSKKERRAAKREQRKKRN